MAHIFPHVIECVELGDGLHLRAISAIAPTMQWVGVDMHDADKREIALQYNVHAELVDCCKTALARLGNGMYAEHCKKMIRETLAKLPCV